MAPLPPPPSPRSTARARQRSRRAFLTDLGRTSAGLLVVGPVAAACASDADAPDPVVDGDGDVAVTAGAAATETTTDVASAGAGGDQALGPTVTASLVDLGFVAAYVLSRAGAATVVDTGVAESEPAILQVLEELGLGWGDVEHVILTHGHGDHVGSLAAVAELAAGAALHAGAADIPSVQAPRDIAAVGDGDRVFDLDIIETPGHTAGHISVYDPAGRLLVVGDALVGEGGGLAPPPARFTADMAVAGESVAKLAGYDVERVLVGHGFPVEGAGTAALRALADEMAA